MIKLDYTIESPEERKQLVDKILEENPNLSDKYLEILADYLVLAMEKQERKERRLLTENRMSTINKREMSFEGLVSQFENGEDGIYNLITNDKNQIFHHPVKITDEDRKDIPLLQQLYEAIKEWEKRLKTASGRSAYIIKQTIIDLQRDQYLIKNAYRKPITTIHSTHSANWIPLIYNEEVIDGEIVYSGVTLLDYKVCSAILCNYSKLKANGDGNFMSDLWYLMESFDKLADRALADFPLYERLAELKVDGKQNIEIQETLQSEFGIHYSLEYISSLWRNKIPKLIADKAQDEFLDWWYTTQERGTYKKCSRCGQIKLAHNRYFSKNKTSKDGWYSLCKCCRNAKK